MALSPNIPLINLEAYPRIPASLVGSNGLKVEKVGGVWTIIPDFGSLTTITASEVIVGMFMWVKDPNEDFYYKVPLSAIVEALPPGPPGETPEFSIGTVDTVPYGDPATVTITGTDEAPVLNFEIPAGANGAGDVSGAGSSVDGEIVLFNGTGGNELKRANQTGILKATSGVLAAAVAGTDYLAPAAIGTTVQAYDADLAAIAALSPTNNYTLQYVSGSWAMRQPSDVRVTLGLAIGSDVQAYDADTLKADVTDDLDVGFTSASKDQGTKSSGTFTPAFASGNVQHYTNGGAHTLAPPSSGNGSIVIDMTNNGSAGAVTTSGFTKVTGDSLTTTNGHKFRLFVTVGNAGSHLHKQAMQ